MSPNHIEFGDKITLVNNDGKNSKFVSINSIMDLLKEMDKDLKEMNKDLKKHADELKKTLNNENTRTPSTENKENKTNGKFKCDINKTINKDNESEKINDNIPQIMKKEMTILVDNISDQVNKQIIATNKINVSGKFETYSTVKDFSRSG